MKSLLVTLLLLSQYAFADVVSHSVENAFEGVPARSLVPFEQEMSCQHLYARMNVHDEILNKISNITGLSIDGTDDFQTVVDGVKYYLPQFSFENEKMAGVDSLIVDWFVSDQVVKKLGLDSADAFLMAAAAQNELSTLDFNFKSHRRQIEKTSNGWVIHANVRAIDICLTQRIDLVALRNCEIDRTQFDACTEADCIQPVPFVKRDSCQTETLSLSLQNISREFPGRTGEIRRHHPDGAL